MGYTHYWKITKPILLSEKQRELINKVLQEHISVVDNNPAGAFHEDVIAFNGNGEDSHETFYVELLKKTDFEFCKTARKPYDIVVCKILLVLGMSKGFSFSSDGNVEKKSSTVALRVKNKEYPIGGVWPDAIAWFEAATGQPA